MADDLATGVPDVGGSAAPAGGVPSGGSPEAYRFDENTQFIPPGSEKPVAYKDFVSGFVPKSDLTRMRQQDAREKADWQAQKQREEASLRQTAQQLASRLGPPQGQTADPLAELANAPYIDGKTFAGLVTAMRTELGKRDQAVQLLNQQIQQMSKGFTTIQGRNQQAEVDGLFAQAQKGLGLPDNPQVRELIQDQYLAHEGWQQLSPEDQLTQLQELVKTRYEGLQQLFRSSQQQRVDQARKAPFNPAVLGAGKPGVGRPKGSESAEDLAARMWPLIQPSVQT